MQNERARFERYLEMLLDRRVEALIVVANWLFVNIDVASRGEVVTIERIQHLMDQEGV